MLLDSVSLSTRDYVCVLSHFSRVQLFVTPWTVPCQAPLSMGFSLQDYRHGLPFSPAGNLPDPEIEPAPPNITIRNELQIYFFSQLQSAVF